MDVLLDSVLCRTFPFVLTHTLPTPCPQGAHTLVGRHCDKVPPLLSRGAKTIGDHPPLAFRLCRMAGQGLMTTGVPQDCPRSIPITSEGWTLVLSWFNYYGGLLDAELKGGAVSNVSPMCPPSPTHSGEHPHRTNHLRVPQAHCSCEHPHRTTGDVLPHCGRHSFCGVPERRGVRFSWSCFASGSRQAESPALLPPSVLGS